MTRHDPANGGADAGVGTHRQATSPVAGTVVRLTDPEDTAADLIERRGPAYTTELAAMLARLTDPGQTPTPRLTELASNGTPAEGDAPKWGELGDAVVDVLAASGIDPTFGRQVLAHAAIALHRGSTPGNAARAAKTEVDTAAHRVAGWRRGEVHAAHWPATVPDRRKKAIVKARRTTSPARRIGSIAEIAALDGAQGVTAK